MNFRLQKPDTPPVDSRFEYLEGEHSLFFHGELSPSAGGVLINDLALEVSISGVVTSLSGLCPESRWQRRALAFPECPYRELIVGFDKDNQAGVYQRINDDRTWPVFASDDGKVLCVGDPDIGGECARFLNDAVIVLGENGSPVALWLRLVRSFASWRRSKSV